MKDTLSRFTLRIAQIWLDKLDFIAAYECRTKNKELELLIRNRVAEFEDKHGKILFNQEKDLENPGSSG